MAGPSPRVWGLRQLQETLRNKFPVHPHACGDYPPISPRPKANAGPSPRVWGLPKKRAVMDRMGGPSPRVWGLPCGPVCVPGCSRSIPTRVGTTGLSAFCAHLRAVHPHACGDYALEVAFAPSANGPSPRVWGLLRAPEVVTLKPRSIPTRVGTTSAPSPPRTRPAVHPHACGDYGRPSFGVSVAAGPSPRVWGLRPPTPGGPGTRRSIPTRVGTTKGVPAEQVYEVGPSPRVWGLRFLDPLEPVRGRSIPTRVGTTFP